MSALIKRVFDFCASAAGILVLSPVLLLAGIAVKLDSPGPILFRQIRVGRYGKNFTIFKFRSMTVDKSSDHPGITTSTDTRITRVGEFLRKTKIDELPQLFNVLLGHMSLVGPRPEIPKFVAYYPDDIKDVVLSVRPGITDQASIEFRDESALLAQAEDPEAFYIEDILPRKLELYARYVRERSFFLDIRIILSTLIAI